MNDRFARYLTLLYERVATRDSIEVHRLLSSELGRRLPRDVREEVMTLLLERRGSFRAPIRLLRFIYVQQQLSASQDVATGGEQLELAINDPPTVPDRGRLIANMRQAASTAEDSSLPLTETDWP